jgi:glycosyltransferase involved in cell wall biosynthesis
MTESRPGCTPLAEAPRAETRPPRVSVALCTFEGERYVSSQLESLLAQTRLPDELVVCDDGSRDGTLRHLIRFAARAPFPVRVEVNEERLGATANFEKAIALCTGDLIAPCDQDDVWRPVRVARAIEVFESDPRIGMAFSDADVVDEELRPLGHRLWKAVGFSRSGRGMVRRARAFDAFLRRWIVTGTTMTFRSVYRPLVLPIPRSWVHDAWIAMLVAAVAPVALIDEPLVLYREHPGQLLGAAREGPLGFLRRARETGSGEYAIEAERFRLLRQRLEDQGHLGRDPSLRERLDAKVAHQDLRLAISRDSSRASRIAAALRELARGGYSRYSARTFVVLKDLLFP